MITLCLALYFGPIDDRPLVEVCHQVSEDVRDTLVAQCNHDDRCEWIVTQSRDVDRLEWTLLPRSEEP